MSTILARVLSLAAFVMYIGVPVLAAQGQAGAPKPPQLLGPQMRGDGPAPTPKPFIIRRVDELDTIVAADAKVELMASGFGINEGVLWIREGASGYLLLSSLIDNVMYKITPDHKVSVFMEKAGYSGDDPSHVGLQTRAGRTHVIIIGPNCATLDAQGRLVWCAGQDLAVKRLEMDGTRTVLANGFEGKPFNGPNDIAIKSDGSIYIADSDVGLRDGRAESAQTDAESCVALERRAGDDGAGRENAGRQPERHRLLARREARVLQRAHTAQRFDVRPDGTLANGVLFGEGEGIIGGMRVDKKGNIYSTSGAGPGVIRITSPSGKLLGFLDLPILGGTEPKRQICATNLAFGGDGCDLYESACDAVYKIRLKAQGIVPGPDGRMVSVVK